MNFQLRPRLTKAERRLRFEGVALLMQGGGALGAYQGGVYEALAEASIYPDWIAGIPIGAINAAIIAGNQLNSRVDRLCEFWTHVSSSVPWDWSGNFLLGLPRSDDTRNLLNQIRRFAPWRHWDGLRSGSACGPVRSFSSPRLHSALPKSWA
jgi:NTE family protein